MTAPISSPISPDAQAGMRPRRLTRGMAVAVMTQGRLANAKVIAPAEAAAPARPQPASPAMPQPLPHIGPSADHSQISSS